MDSFRREIDRHGMIRPGDRVLAAVSGGGDSVLLLHLLRALRASLPFTLTMAHLNHGLRGEAADADEAFVRALADRLALDLRVERADLGRGAGDPSSLEERARDARRDFLVRTARETGCARIALGHTLDDQAETVLMWLLRGTGRGGLAGMEPVTPEGLIRPLLRVRRSEARAHLHSMGETYRDDETNDDPGRTRNWIRHELVPLIERRFPGAVSRMGAVAGSLGGEEILLDGLAAALVREADGGLTAPAGGWDPDREALLAARAARIAAERAGMDPRLLERDHIEAILDLARERPEGRGVDLPGGFRAESRGGAVLFRRRAAPDGIRR